MSRSDHIQFNIRSAFARSRAQELAKLTGMSITQIVEDALRGYIPPGTAQTVGRLVQRGPILVRPANGARISHAEAETARNAVRERDLED